MTGDADIAKVGALVADPARARILLALGDGRSLAASVLAGGDGGFNPDGARRDRLSAPGSDVDYRLTEQGRGELTAFGIDFDALAAPGR